MLCDPRFGGFKAGCGNPEYKGGSDCQSERKGISRFSRCSIVWFANRNFGLIYFSLQFFFCLFFFVVVLLA